MKNMEHEVELYPHQRDAVNRLRSGSVLKGGVGSGKTLTSLFFYKEQYSHKKLFVITTAKKRNSCDWQNEARMIGITDIVVDSWNNILNYKKYHGEFFIFDEQKSVGYNTWGKAMVYIARRNSWIMCTATPGDKWMDYMPLFLANNFYQTKTEFINKHVEYNPYVNFPQIKKFHNEDDLYMWRNRIVVKMPDKRKTIRHREYKLVNHPRQILKQINNTRWNPITDEPIENISEYCALVRRIVNSDPSRVKTTIDILKVNKRVIVFYNFEYEIELLREACKENNIIFSEYNGKHHDPLPEGDVWVYFVNYAAGAEAWNCITTDTMVFYSLSYSYRTMEQAEGRIDRMNTSYRDLHYYYLISRSDLDGRILEALKNKQDFNEKEWGERAETGKGLSKGFKKRDKEAPSWVSRYEN